MSPLGYTLGFPLGTITNPPFVDGLTPTPGLIPGDPTTARNTPIQFNVRDETSLQLVYITIRFETGPTYVVYDNDQFVSPFEVLSTVTPVTATELDPSPGLAFSLIQNGGWVADISQLRIIAVDGEGNVVIEDYSWTLPPVVPVGPVAPVPTVMGPPFTGAWRIHAESDTDITFGVDDEIPPMGSDSGVNALNFRSTSSSRYKRLAMVNEKVGRVTGQQEISFAARYSDSAGRVSLGLIFMWDGRHLDRDSAYVLEFQGVEDGVGLLQLRKGPQRDGEVLGVGTTNVNVGPTWHHVMVQVKYDQSRNMILNVYHNSTTSVMSPVWVHEIGPIVVPRAQASFYGKFAMFVASREDEYNVQIDSVRVNTTLTV